MTTTVKVHVNGDYETTVVQSDIHGERTTVISGVGKQGGAEHSFFVPHPAEVTFKITEEYKGPQGSSK